MDDVKSMATACLVFLFLALLAAFSDRKALGRFGDVILAAAALFAFCIWWPLIQNAALPAHFA